MTPRVFERDPALIVVGEGKSFLRHMGGASARIERLRPGFTGEPDLIVFPCSQNLNFIEEAVSLPDELWAKARAGRAVVVFDSSLEGRPHEAAHTDALHEFLVRVGVSPAQAVYLTQDRQYEAHYLAHRSGRDGEPIQVIVYDYWIRRFANQYGEAVAAEAVFDKRLAAYRARPRRRERRFLCLNSQPRPGKVLFLLSLLRDDLWREGFVSFGGFSTLQKVKGRKLSDVYRDLFNSAGFEDLAAELAPLLPVLDAKGPIVFSPPQAELKADDVLVYDAPLTEFGRSWFSVVTETELFPRPLRITEKPFKGLFNFHPLIVLGNPGSLAILRGFGFQTFPELFDESYDEEPDPRRRFDMVYAQVRRLCAMDEASLAKLDDAVSEKVVFNAEFGLTRLYKLYRDQIDVELVERIMARARG